MATLFTGTSSTSSELFATAADEEEAAKKKTTTKTKTVSELGGGDYASSDAVKAEVEAIKAPLAKYTRSDGAIAMTRDSLRMVPEIKKKTEEVTSTAEGVLSLQSKRNRPGVRTQSALGAYR